MLLFVTLLFLLLFKHALADGLQSSLISRGKRLPWPQFVAPLFFHAYFHAVGTYIVVWSLLIYMNGYDANLRLVFLATAIDFGTHFAIDKAKVTVERHVYGRGKSVLIGLDQLAHVVVQIVIAFLVVNKLV